MEPVSDRIEKRIFLRAPVKRVWRAISDSKEFGAWFGVEFDGPFLPNSRLKGKIVPTKADPEMAKKQESHRGMVFDFSVERVEPERQISFRWHPYAIDPALDYSNEPTTLIVFDLVEQEGGTLLTISESGFDRIPLARRAEAFTKNEEGWTAQAGLIEKYLAQTA